VTGGDLAARVAKRARLLEALRSGPKTSTDLEGTLESSRSTVHRALTEFAEAGLVRRTDDGYELTTYGESVTAEVTTYRDRVGTAERLRPFLAAVEPTDVDLPLEALADAEVVSSGGRRAHLPLKRVVDRIEAASSLKLFSSVASPLYLDALCRKVQEGAAVEAVFDAGVVEILFSDHREQIREAVQTGRFEVLVEDACPYELFVFDGGRLGLAAHDRDGVGRAYVESAAADAVSWGLDRYRSVRDGASHVTVL
jgi:predicted transcriptional regulator